MRSSERRDRRLKEQMDLRSQIMSNKDLPAGVSPMKPVEAYSPRLQKFIQEEESKYHGRSEFFEMANSLEIYGELDFASPDWEKATKFTEKIIEAKDIRVKTTQTAKEAVKVSNSPVEAAEKAIEIAEQSGIKLNTNKFWETVFDALDRFMASGSNTGGLKPAFATERGSANPMYAITIACILVIAMATACIANPEIVNATEEPVAALTTEIEPEATEPATQIATATEESGVENPSDPTREAQATEEAKLTAAQLENEIEEAADAVDVEVEESSSFAAELYKLDYISPATNKDVLVNTSTGRPYIRLNEASPYGPAGTLITPGINGGVLFISGEANNISDINIDGNYIATGTAENGATWVVDAESGTWMEQSEGQAEQVIGEISEEEMASLPVEQQQAIIEARFDGGSVYETVILNNETLTFYDGESWKELSALWGFNDEPVPWGEVYRVNDQEDVNELNSIVGPVEDNLNAVNNLTNKHETTTFVQFYPNNDSWEVLPYDENAEASLIDLIDGYFVLTNNEGKTVVIEGTANPYRSIILFQENETGSFSSLVIFKDGNGLKPSLVGITTRERFTPDASGKSELYFSSVTANYAENNLLGSEDAENINNLIELISQGKMPVFITAINMGTIDGK